MKKKKVVKKGEVVSEKRRIVPTKGSETQQKPRVLVGTLNLFTSPARGISEPLQKRFGEKYAGKYRFARAFFVFDLILLATILVLAGVLAFALLSPIGPESPFRLSLTSSAQTVKGGESVGFTIRYENHTPNQLEDVVLALRLPDGFRLSSISGLDSKISDQDFSSAHHTISLDSLQPGGNGVIRLSGVLLGTNQKEHFRVLMTGISPDKDGYLQESADVTVIVQDSVFAIHTNPEFRPVLGEPFAPRVTVLNTGNGTVQDLRVLISGDDVGTVRFRKDISLGAGDGFTAVVPYEDIPRTPRFTIRLADANQEGSTLLSEEIKFFPVIDGPKITITEAKAYSNRVSLRVDIDTGDTEVEDLQVRVFASDWSVFDLERMPADVVVEGIRVDPNSGVLDIPLFQGAVLPDALLLQAEVFGLIGDELIGSASLPTLVEPPGIGLISEARFYTDEGEQLGLGPLPPRVGSDTEYWALFRLDTGGQTLENVVLRITLPPSVSWTGKQSISLFGGNPVVAEGNTLVWRASKLTIPAGFPESIAVAVALSPTTAMVGTEPVLISSSQLSGMDVTLGERVVLDGGVLTTNLSFDARARELGTKVEPNSNQ